MPLPGLFHRALAYDGGAVLALDLGNQTGWALHNAGGPVRHGTTDFTRSRHEGIGVRYHNFRRWLIWMRATQVSTDIEMIFYERVTFGRDLLAIQAYGGYEATLTSWAEGAGLPYAGVTVGEIKRFITGRGNADKRMVIEAVRTAGYAPKTSHDADAIAILMLGLERLAAEQDGATA